jgi:hypothetical protein
VTEARDPDSQATHSHAGTPATEWSQAGIGTYRVYADGTILREVWTPAGKEVATGSIVGASARVEQFGARMLFRDSRRAFLTIQGPQVAISVEINNYVNVAAGVRRFAAQVNELAQRLASATAASSTGPSVPDQIGRLAKLRDDGILTDDEFEQAKKRLLAQA